MLVWICVILALHFIGLWLVSTFSLTQCSLEPAPAANQALDA